MPARPIANHLRAVPDSAAERRHAVAEPLVDGRRPSPPSWLPREGKAEWRRIVAAVEAWPGWLRSTDRAALVAYCAAWAVWVEAMRDVAERGALVPGRSSADAARDGAGLVKNPSVQVARDAAVSLRSWARELGFTPDARGRIDLGAFDPPDASPDDFDV